MNRLPALSRLIAFARREVGMVAALLGLAVLLNAFIFIADEVVEGETNHFDRAVLMALRVPGRPHQPIGPQWLDMAARDFTSLGSITVLATFVLLAAGLFASLRRVRQGLMLIAAGLGGILVSQLIKGWVGRARPDLVFRAVEAANPSFPSGHAMLSAIVFLSLGALTARFATQRRIKTYVMAAAVLMTVLVGATRVYLGVHWLTDVLAGWTLGSAWALMFWLIEWAWERRAGAPQAGANGTAPDDGGSG
jgi:undecaprenyl-diphosphatase